MRSCGHDVQVQLQATLLKKEVNDCSEAHAMLDSHQELEAKWTFLIGCGRFVTVKVGVYRGWKLKKSIDGTDNTFITKGAFKLVHDLAKVVDGVLAGGRYR